MIIVVKGTIPIREVTHIVPPGTSPAEAVMRFQTLYPDARVESLNGELVRGICRSCGAPVMEQSCGHEYDPDPDLGYTCAACVSARGSN